jgi:hypothetical protein
MMETAQCLAGAALSLLAMVGRLALWEGAVDRSRLNGLPEQLFEVMPAVPTRARVRSFMSLSGTLRHRP